MLLPNGNGLETHRDTNLPVQILAVGVKAAVLSAVVLYLAMVPSSANAQLPCSAKPNFHAKSLWLEGTECADTIVIPGTGVLKITGGGGDDIIFANEEVLEVYGGSGDDHIYGEPQTADKTIARLHNRSNDRGVAEGPVYRVASANPHQNPEAGRASSMQATASVVIKDGIKGQELVGGSGEDWLYGQRGQDTLMGNGGNDLLYGGPGDDTANGGGGLDILGGGYGADKIDGQEDSDMARGDASTDAISDSGASGVDTLSFATATAPGFAGSPSMEGFSPTNFPAEFAERGVYVRLDGQAGPCGTYEACNRDAAYGGGEDDITAWQFENIIGSPFSDVIVGNASNNRIDGGGGADAIYGSEGTDVLVGGADGDFISGGGGTDTAYGISGYNNCYTDVESKVECQGSAVEVRIRDTNKISVGIEQNTLDQFSRSMQLYLVGSNLHDSVYVEKWWDVPTNKWWIAFKTFGDSVGLFDTASTTPQCFYSTTQVLCELPALVDSIELAGMPWDDQLNISFGNLHEETSPVLIGGTGSDDLWGSAGTEDALVDGDGPGDDWATAYAWDDVLTNNLGVDELEGGEGNDLFLSTATCEGDKLYGWADVDSASWAKMPTGLVIADLEVTAGQPGNGRAGDTFGGLRNPLCSSGVLTTLSTIEDLEGSDGNDRLYGDSLANNLLGRKGGDQLWGRSGNDRIEAANDGVIDSGGGDADSDTCVLDISEKANFSSCETIK